MYSDTTGGLNRAGEIVLLVPLEHELLTLANASAYWLRVPPADAAARASRPTRPRRRVDVA